MTINQSLKIKIKNDYLSGMRREDIAKKNGISTGSVSAIAEEFEEGIPDIHKIRAMMLKLNATGNDPKLFYHAIRLHKYIKNQGLTEAKAEYILEIFQEYAFKKNCNISEIIDAVIEAYNIAARCGTDLEHLDQHAYNTGMVLQANEALIRKQKNDIEILPYKYNIKKAELEEYQRNKPTLQKFMNLINELDIEKRRIKLLEEDNKTIKSQKHNLEIENERLKQLPEQQHQQSKNEDRDYPGYQQDIVNFDSTNCLVDDSNDVEDNIDSFDRPQ